jgi:hypothetical protein
MISQLKQDPIPLEIVVDNQNYEGEALPIMATLIDDIHYEFEIILNNKNLGIIRRMKSGWKIDTLADKKLIREIGKQLQSF